MHGMDQMKRDGKMGAVNKHKSKARLARMVRDVMFRNRISIGYMVPILKNIRQGV
jgi:hypothetical protein